MKVAPWEEDSGARVSEFISKESDIPTTEILPPVEEMFSLVQTFLFFSEAGEFAETGGGVEVRELGPGKVAAKPGGLRRQAISRGGFSWASPFGDETIS
jgi:hypothetical protein